MTAVVSLFSSICYKTKKFISKRIRGIKLFFNFSVKPTEEEKAYKIPVSWRQQQRQDQLHEVDATVVKQQEAQHTDPQIKISHAYDTSSASLSRQAASNISTNAANRTMQSHSSSTMDTRKFVLPKWHFPGLLRIKRVLAGILMIVNLAFSQFLLGATQGTTQIFTLMFVANAFLLADYLWKTRKPTTDTIMVERIRHSETQ